MSVELPAKLSLISVSGYRFSKASAITGKTSVSDAAAETVRVPLGFGAAPDALGKNAPNPTTKVNARNPGNILFINSAPARLLHWLIKQPP